MGQRGGGRGGCQGALAALSRTFGEPLIRYVLREGWIDPAAAAGVPLR
jgi:hypothetical protein